MSNIGLLYKEFFGQGNDNFVFSDKNYDVVF